MRVCKRQKDMTGCLTTTKTRSAPSPTIPEHNRSHRIHTRYRCVTDLDPAEDIVQERTHAARTGPLAGCLDLSRGLEAVALVVAAGGRVVGCPIAPADLHAKFLRSIMWVTCFIRHSSSSCIRKIRARQVAFFGCTAAAHSSRSMLQQLRAHRSVRIIAVGMFVA